MVWDGQFDQYFDQKEAFAKRYFGIPLRNWVFSKTEKYLFWPHFGNIFNALSDS